MARDAAERGMSRLTGREVVRESLPQHCAAPESPLSAIAARSGCSGVADAACHYLVCFLRGHWSGGPSLLWGCRYSRLGRLGRLGDGISFTAVPRS